MRSGVIFIGRNGGLFFHRLAAHAAGHLFRKTPPARKSHAARTGLTPISTPVRQGRHIKIRNCSGSGNVQKTCHSSVLKNDRFLLVASPRLGAAFSRLSALPASGEKPARCV